MPAGRRNGRRGRRRAPDPEEEREELDDIGEGNRINQGVLVTPAIAKQIEPSLSLVRQTLCQVLLVEPIMKADTLLNLILALLEEFETTFGRVGHRMRDGTEDGFIEEFVGYVNGALAPVEMVIRSVVNEVDGSLWYGLIPSRGDPEAMNGLSSALKPAQVSFYKALLVMIVESGSELPLQQALTAVHRVPAKDGTVTMREAETLIYHLIEDSWLAVVEEDDIRNDEDLVVDDDSDDSEDQGRRRRGRRRRQARDDPGDPVITIGQRGLLELGNAYLPDLFPEGAAPECVACHDMVLRGQYCAQCSTVMHDHCKESLFGRPGARSECPTCRRDWPLRPLRRKAVMEAQGELADDGAGVGGDAVKVE